MTDKLSTLIGSSVLATGVVLAASGLFPAQAASISFTVNEFTGDNATALITLDDMVSPGDVKATVDITGSPTGGDLRGVFFDIAGVLPSTLTIAGADVTDFATSDAGDLDSLGGGNVIDPGAPFEAAIDIATPGTPGGVLIQSTMFTISSSAGDLSLANFVNENFGVRIQATTGPSGSSKLQGEAIPEPLTMLGVGTAVGFGTLFKKRLAKTKKG